jgi:hypothetical protein
VLEGRLAPTVTLSISNPVPFSKPESGQTQGIFVVTRSGDLVPVVQVDYATQDGTGTNGAHAGTDYVATSGTISFAPGQTTATITVPIIGTNVFQADKTFTVQLSNPSSASFAPETSFSFGTASQGIAVGDFNGDGKPDLAIADPSFNRVAILLNTTPTGATTPSFAPPQTFNITGDNVHGGLAVAVGDFNGDGKPDLVVADGPFGVSVLLNRTPTGSTTLSFSPETLLYVSIFVQSVAVGDFNGDGKPDLAVVGNNSANVAVFLNTTPTGGPLSFTAPQYFPDGGSSSSVAVGDFNGDSKLDIATAIPGNPGLISVLVNRTPTGAMSASFAPPQTFGVSPGPTTVAVGDVNRDGKPDLIAVGGNTSSVLLNTTPTGAITLSFAPAQTFPVGGTNPLALAVADFNGHGKPDLVFANALSDTVTVLLNGTPTGSTVANFSPPQPFYVNSYPVAVVAADFNGDGKPDLAVINQNPPGTISVLLNTWNPAQITLSGSPATGTISAALEAPASIAIVPGSSGQSSAVNTAFALPLAVDVRDAANFLVRGVSVTFTAPASGASGTFGSSNTVTVMSNAAGRASAPAFMANTVAGSFTVASQAAGGNNPFGSFSLTNTPGAPAALSATAGGNQSTVVNTAFTIPLLATLTDQYGNRIPGVTVTFTAPSSGASAVFITGNTGTTDANGQVSKAIIANTAVGTYNVTAQASGGSNPSATFANLTNNLGSEAILTATAGSNQSAGVNTAFGTNLVATLTDQYGNPVSGVLVTFYAPSFGASATFPTGNTGTTDANGQVSKKSPPTLWPAATTLRRWPVAARTRPPPLST